MSFKCFLFDFQVSFNSLLRLSSVFQDFQVFQGVFKLCFYSKDVRLPVQLQRAMAAEAEAAREARAKVNKWIILSHWCRKGFGSPPGY